MTLQEIKNTFHVDTHDLVPEYEVVPIHHIRRRSLPDDLENTIDVDEPITKSKENLEDGNPLPKKAQLRLKAFGVPYNLRLAPNQGLFKKGKLKIWTIEPNATAQHGVEYVELPETNDDIGELYQDEENQAAILMRTEDDGVRVEGSIGSHLVIKPLPDRLRGSVIRSKNGNDTESINDDEMFLDQDGELSAEVAIDTGLPINRNSTAAGSVQHHIVYRRMNKEEEDAFSDYAFMEPDHLGKRFKRSISAYSSRKKREAPYTIYPEILVIVDYDGYRLHGGDNVQVKRYFVSFWNGVDLRYKLLKGPKIRISIAGIIISRGRDATPYLERNRVGRDAIDSAAALTDMGKYLFRERRLPVYDIAVAITKYDMCRRRKGGRCTKGTAGFAYVGGACVVNKRLEKVNSVAIIEDTGGFSGIIVAAHEVGHLLGAVHDGSPPPSYLGGPGAEKCQWTDGYIMSDLRHTERGFRWSPCSISSFHHFLNGDTATCLYNTPHEDENLPRVLPGKLLTLDAQCRRDRGTSACFKDDRVCAQLFCFDSNSGYCVAYRPAAEGSTCGDGQYCLNGRCVAEHENIIPDYSQNAASYLRNSPSRPLYEVSVEEVTQNPFEYYTTQPQYYTQYDTNQHSSYNTVSNQPSPYDTVPNQQNPYQNTFTSTSAPITRFSFKYNFVPFSTTKSPYNFENFAKTAKSPSTASFLKNIFSTRRATTKSPYDFANFGISTESPYSISYHDNVNNNYLKRSYNDASYYTDSSNVNATYDNRRLIG
ncbi:unnamed protein product [Acanthoscelides obtectus]|uniref:Peptidase M12B domain-containing protein n=1 Tax=Acanthoscelides obtectus TaxID=200917 RepID=A0A9P0JRB2_ACAOB|nr:unnamed protein product [Acanthoscelides obtectus]CAK1671293.1 hypothetical protein AOBTE_LOCUS28209 [Acanthoscelides obtectus]